MKLSGWLGMLVLVVVGAGCVAVPPGKIAFESYRDGNAEVYVVDVDGANPVNLTTSEGYDGTPVWSPDGAQIAFTSVRDGPANVYIMDADGTNVWRLTEEGESNSTVPAWSPDGSKIAFLSDRYYEVREQGGYTQVEANSKIWVKPVEGGDPERLSRMLGLDMYASWGPDSSELVYMSVRDGNPEIYLLRSDNIELNLTDHPARDMNPEWSPDGSKIAFMSDREGTMDLFVMDPDGSNLVNLTADDVNNGDPAWSPDGMQIAFTSDRDGNSEIYVMDADGSNVRRLTNDPAKDQHPAWWQPD